METIQNFRFQFTGYGHYKVTYISPKTNRAWVATIDNMPLIDATMGADEPNQKDLQKLKKLCKS